MPEVPSQLKPWTQFVAFAVAVLTLWGFVIAPIEHRISAVEEQKTRDVATLKIHVDEVLDAKLTAESDKNRQADRQLQAMDKKIDQLLEGMSRLDERTLWLQRQHTE